MSLSMEWENRRLHEDTIAQVNERVDLIDVVSDYVVLRKRGKEFVGLCPFHEEKTPSFTVSPSKQVYYCFGCGASGNAIKFLMEINKMSFPEAVVYLAQRYQIPIKTLAVAEQKEIEKRLFLREQLYKVLAVANHFFEYNLQQEQGKHALDYLLNIRGLTRENISQFGLGYAPDGWNSLYTYLVEIKGFPALLVEKAGLIKKRSQGDGYVDYFRNRVTIPIRDREGRIIGFGARSLDENEPKYLNSPDTELFSKGETLFALNFAKSHIAKEDKAVVVEGYFDAISLHCAGIKNVVATLGAALTEKHVKILSRYTSSREIIINFDADNAGHSATERAVEAIEKLIYSGFVKLRILTITGGKDADEFLKSEANAVSKYRGLMEKAPLWLDWQISQILSRHDINRSDGYQNVFSSLVQLLKKINNRAARDYYLSHCAEILSNRRGVVGGFNSEEYELIYQSLKQAILSQNKPHISVHRGRHYESLLFNHSSNRKVYQAEFTLLFIYIHCPEFRRDIENLLDEKDLVFSLRPNRKIWQKIHQLSPLDDAPNSPNILLSFLAETTEEDPEYKQTIAPLVQVGENQQHILANPSHYIQASIAYLEAIKLERYRQYCQEKIKELDLEKDREKIRYFSQEIVAVTKQLEELKAARRG
ncbi:MAG: DNA primase [Geminocystis sp.]|nr:DNA primase [Geminocystis sp.]MCS7147163.1 DNA primase [Geminocystis sp.]MDW8116159.1 DNA primase [Geminocystis sp.]MDW8462850.1 DNA primase [Geminocystis sp.]